MSFVGGDSPGMRRLASKMEEVAVRLDNIQGSIGSELESVPWAGKDADRYREMWRGEYATSMGDAARKLKGAASDMRGDAQTQDRISGGSSW